MKLDDAFDAALTPLGEAQAAGVRAQHRETLAAVELIVSSPLSRAVRTAAIAMGTETRPIGADDESVGSVPFMLTRAMRRQLRDAGLDDDEIRHITAGEAHALLAERQTSPTPPPLQQLPPPPPPPPRFVAIESLRERNGLLLNGSRRTRSELAALHPFCDFTYLEDEGDVSWSAEALESAAGARARALESVRWIMEQPETTVLCAAHGGIFSALFAAPAGAEEEGESGAFGGEEGGDAAVERVHIDAALFERFGNCELRSVRVMATGEGGGDGELQHLRLSPEL